VSDQVSVNTDGLLAAAPGLNDLASRVRDVYTALSARLDELGQPWGDDQTGEAFLANYQDPKEQLLTGIDSTGSVLGSTADGVVTMAKGFAQTEAENRAAINLGSESGGGNPGSTGRTGAPGS
jgi:uncharacterized protein YukE